MILENVVSVSRLVRAGERVFVQTGRERAYTTVERIEDNTIVLRRPEYRQNPLSIAIGERVNIFLFRHSGMYSFAAVLRKEFARDGMELSSFAAVSAPLKMQRREAYRVTIALKAEVALDAPPQEPVFVPVRTVDISDKGAGLITQSCYPVGDTVRLRLELPLEEPMELEAKVVRCQSVAKASYQVGLEFAPLANWQQEHLQQFILQYQIVRRGGEQRGAKEGLPRD